MGHDGPSCPCAARQTAQVVERRSCCRGESGKDGKVSYDTTLALHEEDSGPLWLAHGAPPYERTACRGQLVDVEGSVTAVHSGDGRDTMTRPVGPTKVSSSLASPDIVQAAECTR